MQYLKLRDTLNTLEGYQEILDQNTMYIKEDLEDLKNSVDQEYINDTQMSLFKYTLSSLQATYSQGRPVKELRPLLNSTIEHSTTVWNQDYAYTQMVWMLSIGIMLEIDDEEFNKLIKLVESDNPNDYLIDQLIKYRKADWKAESNDFKFPKPYMKIKDVFDSALNRNKEEAIENLTSYVDKAWYKGNSDTGWYDSHKSKFNTHEGYWSYESGAIAKILGLDDAGLEDHQYYPYDLVHYKD
jgi:hypothetical protein